MKTKILLILALVGAVYVSLTVGTLSGYTVASSFGVSIVPDQQKIRQQAVVKLPSPSEAVETADKQEPQEQQEQQEEQKEASSVNALEQ